MAADDAQTVHRRGDEPKSRGHKEKGHSKAEPPKLNSNSLVRDETISSTGPPAEDPPRRKKHRLEKSGKAKSADSSKKVKSPDPNTESDTEEPLPKHKKAENTFTEKLLQDSVISRASEVTTRLDENSNITAMECNGEVALYKKDEGVEPQCQTSKKEPSEESSSDEFQVGEEKHIDGQRNQVSLSASSQGEFSGISNSADIGVKVDPSFSKDNITIQEHEWAKPEKETDRHNKAKKEEADRLERKKERAEKKGNSEKKEKGKNHLNRGSEKESVKKGKENKDSRSENSTDGNEGISQVIQSEREKICEEMLASGEEREFADERKTDQRDPLKSKDDKSGGEKKKSKKHSHKEKSKEKKRTGDMMEDAKVSVNRDHHRKDHVLEGKAEASEAVKLERSDVTIGELSGAADEKVHLRVKSFEEELDELVNLKRPSNKVKKKEREVKNEEKKEKTTSDTAEGKVTKGDDEEEEEEEKEELRAKKAKPEAKKNQKEEKIKVKGEKSAQGDAKDKATTDKKSSSRKRKSTETNGTKAKNAKEAAKKEEEESKWKWWEEDHYEDGVKWKFLEHKGPYFAPPYEPLPDDVTFYYDGKPVKLSPGAEEVATFYGKMLDHEYATKEAFQKNFFVDWREQMTSEEQKLIKHLHKCDFSEIHKYFFDRNEARKALPKEEKQKLKEESNKIQEEYGFCILDGHREKIGNFKIEPPGLFRGRGDHPKMGMLKLRIMPEDVIINCSKESKIPEPPTGHKWKEIRSDNTVTWLASWTENIQSSIKYIMLNPSSKLKGEKDWQKYETARQLKGVVSDIRAQYRVDWKSREMKKRQRAVALYFIDKLALRAGNEKEEGETADTVGCCSLRVEHIQLYPELDGQQYMVEFDFLGKDSIRYYNKVPVEKEVFKNLKLFMENKNPDDDLFDRLNTTILNKHLQDLMDGLTAKVFRTYNASITLQNQLKELTNGEDNVAAKILSYNRANRAVALLCNHQRALPKTFEKSMQNLQTKIDAKEQQLKEAKKELKSAKADYKAKKNEKSKKELEKKKKQFARIEEQLMKLKLQATDKEENKQIALGTSKLNYLDPRISVAWCKKYGVPIEKIYNKTQRDKFAWAIDMTSEEFEF
ncbi:DNA topoisomerase I, mitochondrial isoform X2 [Xenopus laevis]|uniref:DNA topoisomerase I n=1 Tax=Xenopus laevis TaxID=8355 RepID=A0A8J0VLQ3_XENLA|nr:DNA topoisomerase I, mitochondrial isoform X2 [Xenopus laevis]